MKQKFDVHRLPPDMKILIPSDKWGAPIEELYKDELFQILNRDVRIPVEYCLHIYKWVTPQFGRRGGEMTTLVECENCKKRL